jgi:hypothetical protein
LSRGGKFKILLGKLTGKKRIFEVARLGATSFCFQPAGEREGSYETDEY